MVAREKEIEVKPLVSQDWEEFYSLFRQMVTADFSYYPSQVIQRFLEEERIKRGWGEAKEIFVALKDKEIVGFLIGVDAGGGVSFCNWVGVKKEFRGRGIGKLLVQAWEVWAKERGCHKLRAQSSNARNQGFYEKLGFKFEGKRENDRYHLDYWLFGKMI